MFAISPAVCGVHANTVNAVYLDLAARGWVEARRGSGVFVSHVECQPPDDGIHSFANAWVEEGSSRGHVEIERKSTFPEEAVHSSNAHLDFR